MSIQARLTPGELREMRQRVEQATPGPWRVTGYRDITGKGEFGDIVVSREADSGGDAEFIAHARTDMPRLLDENDWLRKAMRQWQGENASNVKRIDELLERITELEVALQAIHIRTAVSGDQTMLGGVYLITSNALGVRADDVYYEGQTLYVNNDECGQFCMGQQVEITNVTSDLVEIDGEVELHLHTIRKNFNTRPLHTEE